LRIYGGGKYGNGGATGKVYQQVLSDRPGRRSFKGGGAMVKCRGSGGVDYGRDVM